MKERRGSPRFAIKLPLRYVVKGENLTEGSGTTHNISRNGLLFCCRRYIAIGSKVQLELKLPVENKAFMRISGIVTRNEGDKTALAIKRLKHFSHPANAAA